MRNGEHFDKKPGFRGILLQIRGLQKTRYTAVVMKSVLLAATLLPCALSLVACDDFASPAELSRPQILAIQSEPASVSPGESTELTLLVANTKGPVESPVVTWSIQSNFEQADEGEIVVNDGRATYIAPATVPQTPTLVTLEAQVEQDGETLIGVKGILIGGPSLVNPTITAITLNDTAADSELVLNTGRESTLAVELESPPSADATYAWYASTGVIDAYRSSPTTIVAPDEPGEGWIVAVVRDRGGIAFHAIETRVE
jgi:hypothetical protein